MTTLATASAVPLRPVRWQRLAWVAWRRYRFTAIGFLVVLGLLVADLLVSGHHLRVAYDQLKACTPSDSPSCQFLNQQFLNKYASRGFLAPVELFLPGILGAFAGAPLIARELESGTFRYAWTQGVGRMRWAVGLLVPSAVVTALVVGAFGAVVQWRQQPLVDYGMASRLDSATFGSTGIAAGGWALLGFALGALAGVVWRRVLPALATAFAVWFGLAYLAAEHLRDHYLAPLRTTSLNAPLRGMQVSQWWTKDGVRVSNAQVNQTLESYGVHVGDHSIRVHATPGGTDPLQALLQHGFRQVTAYQPDRRYWAFQWIEAGWLVVLSVVLLGAVFWLVRRRTA
jgi:hypothetical protein